MAPKKPTKPADIKVEIAPLSDIVLDDKNANLGTEYGMALMDNSFSKHGAGRSVLIDKDRRVVGGNKTVETAVDHGIEEVIIVHTTGKQLVAVMRDDVGLDTPEGRSLALYDNRTSEKNLNWSGEALIEYGKMLSLDEFFSKEEQAAILLTVGTDDSESEGETVESTQLAKINVTVADPKHEVERSEIWKLGKQVLICADLLTDWNVWKSYLTGDVIFAPYPSPLTAILAENNDKQLVMVCPDPYTCGHALDRFVEVFGEASVAKQS